MRHCRMLAFVALAALIAVPEISDARSRFSLLGAAPFRMIMGGVPGFRTARFHHRRATMARAYAPEASQPEAGSESDRARNTRGSTVSFNPYEDIIGYALWPDEYS